MMVTPTDLDAFGNATAPRLPRPKSDLIVDPSGMVGPESPPRPLSGASTFADPAQAPVRGYYSVLPQGTPLPEGLAVVADGNDVLRGSQHLPTHHTIYPTRRMPLQDFLDLFQKLPWQGPVGKKS